MILTTLIHSIQHLLEILFSMGIFKKIFWILSVRMISEFWAQEF